MRVLLDESVPLALTDLIEGHEVTTVQRHGWQSLANGELLRRASNEFDVFVTSDRNLRHQQNIPTFDLGIVVLAAQQNRIESYIPHREEIQRAIDTVKPATVIEVAA